MEGSIRVIYQEDKTLIKLQGALDQDLAANLVGIANKNEPPFLLDLKQVPHLTVAGSQAIMHFYRLDRLKPEVRGANPNIVSMLELTGASNYITLIAEVVDSSTAEVLSRQSPL